MSATSLSPRKEAMLGLLTPLLSRMAKTDGFTLPGIINNDARILIVDSGDLTELFFFAPVLGNLKYRFPGLRVTVLVREGNSELIRTMDQISEMITYEPEHLSVMSTTYFSLLKRLKSRDFDAAFLLGRENGFSRSLMALLSGAPLRVGFSGDYSFPYLNCEIRTSNSTSYEGARTTGFLNAVGLPSGDSLQGWKLPDEDKRWATQMIHFRKPRKDTRVMAVDPGIGKGSHRLVEKSFAHMVNRIAERFDASVVLVTNNLDAKGLDHFRGLLTADLIDLEPKNVKEGLALLSCADLLLSGNTDFFHFAVGMRIPTLGFFTRYDEDNWFPKGTPAVQIIQGVKGQKLSLDEVYSKIETLLHFAQ